MRDPHQQVVDLARRQDDMVTRRQARELGMSDGAMASRRRDRGWHAPVRGTLLVPPVRDRVRAHARAALAMAGGVVCLLTAGRLHALPGLPHWDAAEPVDIAFGDAAAYRHRDGCRRHSMELASSELTDLGGILTTTIHRTVQDIVLRLPTWVSVPMLDALLRLDTLGAPDAPVPGPEGGTGLAPGLEPNRWGRRSRGFASMKETVLRRSDSGEGPGGAPAFWSLVDGRAGTPLESRVRLSLAEAGIDAEEIQWALPTPGAEQLDRVHLAWPSARLAVQTYELDVDPAQEEAIRDKKGRLHDALAGSGWVTLWFTWHDLHRTPNALVPLVRRYLSRDDWPASRQI